MPCEVGPEKLNLFQCVDFHLGWQAGRVRAQRFPQTQPSTPCPCLGVAFLRIPGRIVPRANSFSVAGLLTMAIRPIIPCTMYLIDDGRTSMATLSERTWSPLGDERGHSKHHGCPERDEGSRPHPHQSGKVIAIMPNPTTLERRQGPTQLRRSM